MVLIKNQELIIGSKCKIIFNSMDTIQLLTY